MAKVVLTSSIVQPGNVRTDVTASRRMAASPSDAHTSAVEQFGAAAKGSLGVR